MITQFSHITPPRFRKQLHAGLTLCLALYLCTVGGFAWWMYERGQDKILDYIDKNLVQAAGNLKYLLAPDFHDRAVSPDALDPSQIAESRVTMSAYAKENELAHVYTIVADKGRYFFSAPLVNIGATAEKRNGFYRLRDDIPAAYVRAFEQNQPVFNTYTDQQGTFRFVALAQSSPGGRRYLVCADKDISHIRSFTEYMRWGLLTLILAALALSFILLKAMFNGKQTWQLREAMAQAEAASKAKGEFLAKMSHEIRTPLNGIIGMTEVIQATALDESQQRVLSIIVQESNHLLNIINNILDFSKIEAGKLEIEAIEFNPRKVLDQVGEGISLQASNKGLDLNVYLSPELPERLIGDPTRLRQVLINMAGNALKFTHEGEISIKGELAHRTDGEIFVRFSVEDTGIGIPDDKMESIFESFTQVDGSTTRKYGGTGLGTTISRQLVELMGGRLGLSSESGKGTAIRFTLPFGLPEQNLITEPDERLIRNNPIVLVVDDCFTSRKIATKYLGTMGCRVEEACDGREALAAIKYGIDKGSPFDLILTDYRMPNMNGYDLARNIRQLDGNKDTPIIAVTGLQEIVEIGNLQDLGFNQCLAKPLKIDELKDAMIAVCGLARTDPASVKKTGTIARKPAAKRQSKGRILLVEDYPTNQQVAIMHLSSAGYQVDLAQNGLQAVEKFKQDDYDLILMDLEMPGMDGYGATMEIRCLEASRKTPSPSDTRMTIPIIATTAHALAGYEKKCSAAGMDDFMTKPLRRAQLLAKVRHWLSHPAPDSCCAPVPPPPALAGAQTEAGTNQIGEQPINLQKALEEFLGQQDVLDNVLRSFQDKVQEQICVIEQALKTNDAETVRKEAHAIKGGAANLIARPLADIARSLENIGKSGCLDNGASVLVTLESELNRLNAFCAKAPR